MTTYGKVWGETWPIFISDTVEVHGFRVKAGWQCSRHKHNHKANLFAVLSGKLLIHAWKNDYDLVDTTELGPGQITTVSATEKHRFEAAEDVLGVEVYWVKLTGNDIERDDVGGEAKEGESDGD